MKQHKVLACAQSNVAADNILEGLVKLGVNVVRYGRPVNVRSTLWNNTVDALLQRRSAWVRARVRLDEAVSTFSRLRDAGAGGEAFGAAQRQLAAAKGEFQQVEIKCFNSVLRGADVVVTSCIGAGAEPLKTFVSSEQVRFSTVLIDEATQCTEAAALSTMVLGCERLILIGDQNQLPPVVLSPDASDKGLGASMFARLVRAGLTPSLLNEQYRMHPKIAEFPADRFYGGLLRSKVDPKDRPLPKGFQWERANVPVTFIDVSYLDTLQYSQKRSPSTDTMNSEDVEVASMPISGGFERLTESKGSKDFRAVGSLSRRRYELQQLGDSVPASADKKANSTNAFRSGSNIAVAGATSYYNSAEADVVEGIVQSLLDDGDLSLGDIGVISPYNAQVRLLTDRFRARGWIEKEVNQTFMERSRSRTPERKPLNNTTNSPISFTSTPRASVTINDLRIRSIGGKESILEEDIEEDVGEDLKDVIYSTSKTSGSENESADLALEGKKEDLEVRSVDGYQVNDMKTKFIMRTHLSDHNNYFSGTRERSNCYIDCEVEQAGQSRFFARLAPS